MVRTAWILLGAVCLGLLPARADGDLAFAVPDDGRVTLGVFNDSGKLVRVLHTLAREDEFRIGLNGLITSWDGMTDDGVRAPAGHYYVRGYLIGENVSVSGEDFLFNDWSADAGFPGLKRIEDFSFLENGDLLLLGENLKPGKSLSRFSPDRGFLWTSQVAPAFRGLQHFPILKSTDHAGHPMGASIVVNPTPPPPPIFPALLTANQTEAFVVSMEGNGVYALHDGKVRDWIAQGAGVPPQALAANESKIYVSSKGGLVETSLPLLSHEDVLEQPSVFTSTDADSSVLIGASPDGVWVRKESFLPVTLPSPVTSVTLGMPGTFWFVGSESDVPFVGQASFSGEILRVLRPGADDPKPEKIRASRKAEQFAVLESSPGLQRIRVMSRAENGEWTIEWERTIRESGAFGFLNGKPVADAGGAAQEAEVRFRLKENPLTGKHDFLTIHAKIDQSGARLVSPDGLPLVEVSSRTDLRRVVIHREDKAGTLRLLQGNGAFVEEFSITGLDGVLPLDAGGIDLP